MEHHDPNDPYRTYTPMPPPPPAGSEQKASFDVMDLLLSWDGRINRAQYWLGIIVLFVLSMITGGVLGVFGTNSLASLIGLLLTISYFFLAIRRFHDLDKTGWFSLLLILPIANLLVGIFWLGLAEGKPGTNRYGPQPV